MPSNTLSVPYHIQFVSNYCGAACLQMAIEDMVGTSPSQDVLYADSHNHGTLDPSTNWASPPDGVDWTMDTVLGTNAFNLLARASENSLTRDVVWSLFKHAAPAIVLTWGKAHWVLVVGYDISANPTDQTDTSYRIVAVDVQDPFPDGETLPPPPPPPKHVAYKEWTRHYLWAVPDGFWKGKVLAVGNFGPAERSAVDVAIGVGITPPDATPIIAPAVAMERAMWGLTQYGLTEREDWKRVLVPGFAPGEPMLVQRLDDLSFYYIVPIGGQNAVRAAVRVDSLTGEYLDATAVAHQDAGNARSWGSLAASMNTESATRARIAGRRLALPGLGGRILARNEGVGVHPSFVWRPCRESLSPLMPFRLVTVGDRVFYVRLDGATFDALHEPIAGN